MRLTDVVLVMALTTVVSACQSPEVLGGSSAARTIIQTTEIHIDRSGSSKSKACEYKPFDIPPMPEAPVVSAADDKAPTSLEEAAAQHIKDLRGYVNDLHDRINDSYQEYVRRCLE